MLADYHFGRFVLAYIGWHYGRGFNEFVEISRNIFNFLIHFFSVKFLLKTLFAPLQKLSEGYERGLHIESFFSTLLVNTIMRIIGALSRMAIIALGLISSVTFVVLAFVSAILWLLAPLVVVSLLASSFFLIYASF